MTPSANRTILAYYITPHGFGHAVRSLEVIRNLLELDPLLDVVVVSDLPDFLIAQNVGRPVKQRRRRLDVGLVQRDSVRFDLDASLEAVYSLHDGHKALVEEEARFLEACGARALVADVPFLAFLASSKRGIPSIGLGNFTWDWIYQGYAVRDNRWDRVVSWIRECYGACDLFLQLPMHGDCSACPTILDVPLVARKARRTREETRAILQCGQGVKAHLVAFASLDLDEKAQRRLEAMKDTLFFYKQPLRLTSRNARSLDGLAQVSYADVIGAMDGVITKPGYGIVSDCLANGTPMVYSDRGHFPEYDILVDWIERHLTAVHLPSGDLYSGDWESAVHRMEGMPRRVPRIRTDGAEVCARIILERLDRLGVTNR
jgi:L-arabinokinase